MMNYSFLAIPLMVILALSALADDQPTTKSSGLQAAAQRDDERRSIPAL
jgi:hypothetical protein